LHFVKKFAFARSISLHQVDFWRSNDWPCSFCGTKWTY